MRHPVVYKIKVKNWIVFTCYGKIKFGTLTACEFGQTKKVQFGEPKSTPTNNFLDICQAKLSKPAGDNW